MDALQAAIATSNVDVVAGILQGQSLDVNSLGPDGLAPLHLAVRGGNLPVCQLLLSYGANPNLCAENSHHRESLLLPWQPEDQPRSWKFC